MSAPEYGPNVMENHEVALYELRNGNIVRVKAVRNSRIYAGRKVYDMAIVHSPSGSVYGFNSVYENGMYTDGDGEPCPVDVLREITP